MPRILFLVVWGREVVMATFSPRIWLRRVDFPTFGRPTIEINPDRKVKDLFSADIRVLFKARCIRRSAPGLFLFYPIPFRC